MYREVRLYCISARFTQALPFTVSHAAAVLPFRRLNLVWSAFIVGSMAPDFPYVIGNTKYRDLGHHFPGLVFFTLPVAFAALWVFHNVIKGPAIGLVPLRMQVRLRAHAGEFCFRGPARLLLILVCLVLGIVTHVVWDSFTHSFSWPWREFRWLRQRVHVPFLGSVPGFSVMQYGSTIVGMLALATWIGLWYRKTVPAVSALQNPPTESRFVLGVAMLVFTSSVGLGRAALTVGTPVSWGKANLFFLIFAVTALGLAFWELLLYCLLIFTFQT